MQVWEGRFAEGLMELFSLQDVGRDMGLLGEEEASLVCCFHISSSAGVYCRGRLE